MLYVVKRDGREVVFNKDKISNAIRKASKEVSKKLDHNEIINITENVYKSILKTEKSSITVFYHTIPSVAMKERPRAKCPGPERTIAAIIR